MSELIKTGLAHHRAGRLREAEAVYRSILKEQPRHPDALYLLQPTRVVGRKRIPRDWDLIAALRARALGKDTSAVLPDANWESLFAALLSVLIRKGLVADWEFVDELARHSKKGS